MRHNGNLPAKLRGSRRAGDVSGGYELQRTDARGEGALPLTSRTYVRFREIRRDDRYRVCDLFGVPVLPLERCPAGGPGGPVPVGWLSEDLADEQGDGSVSAGGALAAVRAAGIGGDVAADQ